MKTMSSPIRLAVLISGDGRTLQNLIDRTGDGTLDARIEVVVSSRAKARGLERARAKTIPAKIVERKSFADTTAFSRAMTAALEPFPFDLLLMAGFMSLYLFPDRWAGRVLNIHPALLPRFGGKGFYGRRVHEAVLAAGARESGCTVHYADGEYDRGPIILQEKVPVLDGDTPATLADRVFEAECRAYPVAIRKVAAEKLGIGGGVR